MIHSRSTLALSLFTVAAGCSSGRPPPPTNRTQPPAMQAPPSCRAVLTPGSHGEYSLRFTLSNPTPRPIALDGYEPFLQFHVRAVAGGAVLAVEQPALDIPVQPITITVPASGSVELITPIRLRFRVGDGPSAERFVWSIAHDPAGVELSFTLELPPPFDQPFTARAVPE